MLQFVILPVDDHRSQTHFDVASKFHSQHLGLRIAPAIFRLASFTNHAEI